MPFIEEQAQFGENKTLHPKWIAGFVESRDSFFL